MQITDTRSSGAFPPWGGGAPSPDIAAQIQEQRSYHRRVLLGRAVRFWWFRILIIVIAAIAAAILSPFASGPYAASVFKYLALGSLAIILVYWCVKRINFGLIVLAILATPFGAYPIPIKSLALMPCIIILAVLFCTLLVQVAFHRRKAFLPSLAAMWPYLGMMFLAIVSVILVQFTWTHGVPKKINSNPIYYDEILGVGIYFFPLIAYMTVTTIVSYWQKLIVYIQNIFVAIAFIASIVVWIEFKRFGGNVSTFRFSDPHVAWMSLRALAQFMVLGAIIAYVRFIIPAPWTIKVDRFYIPYFRRLTRFIKNLGRNLQIIGIVLAVLGTAVAILSEWQQLTDILLIGLGIAVAGILLGLGAAVVKRRLVRSVFAPEHEIRVKAGVVRFFYILLTLDLFGAVIVTLQNSWWVELLVAFLVITIVCSFRLLVFYGGVALLASPLLYIEFQKLQSLKTDDLLRFIIWADSLRVWSKQRVFGVGPGDFWAYDQVFTNLPRIYRNCNATGLCVAHNGYLQTLGELGPIGLLLYIAGTVVIIIAAYRLLRRSKMPRLFKENILNSILQSLGLYEYADLTKRNDRVLALVGLGLACGSMMADMFIGEFMLPPRQVSAFNVIPQILVSWIIYALVLYKDKVWRVTRDAARLIKKPRVAKTLASSHV